MSGSTLHNYRDQLSDDNSVWFVNEYFLAGAAIHIVAAFKWNFTMKKTPFSAWTDVALTMVGWALITYSLTAATVTCFMGMEHMPFWAIGTIVACHVAQAIQMGTYKSYKEPWITATVFGLQLIGYGVFAGTMAAGKTTPLNTAAGLMGSWIPIGDVFLGQYRALRGHFLCTRIRTAALFFGIGFTFGGWSLLAVIANKTCR